MKPHRGIDRPLFFTVLATVVLGFGIFVSAAFGLYARDGAPFASVVQMQAISVAVGFLALFIASSIPYTFWRRAAVPIFVISVLLMIIVVLPGLGFLHGGSRRWIYLASFSFQPADVFKIAVVMLYAAWIMKYSAPIERFRDAVVPIVLLLGISTLLLGLQPKFGTVAVIAAALLSMFLISGAKFKHGVLLALIVVPTFLGIMYSIPYARDRIETFLNPSADPLVEGYQINQALIAVGSGGVFGRGYGQSIQKFNFLPEPIGDSVFAVAAEELGFVGSLAIIFLIVFFAHRCFIIAARAPDRFARLLVLGLAILIVSQSFINIAAMIGLFPLSGMPLVFISHGGTAMVTALASVGIILNVSKYVKT
jgi:cell division protein FtsW